MSIEDNIGQTKIVGNIIQSSPELKLIENDIKVQLSKGFVPLGISYDAGKVWTFMQQDPRSPFKTAIIESYNNNGTDLFAGVEKNLKVGYRLAGFTSATMKNGKSMVLALFLK